MNNEPNTGTPSPNGEAGALEITPEMVEAGVAVLERYDYAPDNILTREVVREILRASLGSA